MDKPIIAYKGFDKDLKCLGFQYEVGKEYIHEGEVEVYESGFHACEAPLEVFRDYPPAKSRYCAVEQFGTLSRGGGKMASGGIRITAEGSVAELVKAHTAYVKAHTTMEHTDPQAATAGDYGAATSRGMVSVGMNGAGLVRGNGVMARGGLGAVLVICVENNNGYGIKEWRAVVVDGETVKADTWYTLKNGELVERGGVECPEPSR